jgi:hypothetical protein
VHLLALHLFLGERMPKVRHKCGCTIYWTDMGPPWVEFCPLHEAAEDLLKALERALKIIRFGQDAGRWKAYYETSSDMKPIREALIKATGKD